MIAPAWPFLFSLVLQPSCKQRVSCPHYLPAGQHVVADVFDGPEYLLGAEVDSDGEHVWIRWTDDDGDHEVEYRVE